MAGSTRTSTTAGEAADVASGAVNEGTPSTQAAKTDSGEAPSGASTTVKYTGPSTNVRRISAKAFKDAGVEGMEDQEWSASNEHTVDASEWPQEALDLIKKQPNFKVSQPKG